MSTTDQQIAQTLQYALLEPPDGGQNWPSGLWDRDEVFNILNQRQNRLLNETFILVGIANITGIVAGTHRVALPTDSMRLVSVVWRGVDGTVKELARSDSFEADHAIPTWELTTTTAPLVYMEEEAPLGQLQIGPAPAVNGLLEILYIPLGTSLNAGNGEILVFPDEFAHGVKYGALADLLNKDGRGQDLGRAAYCQQRYELAKDAAHIILEGWA
jgi:hypothetical protein